MNWQCKTFQELTTDQLYAILKARQEVFIIEQTCIYSDLDNLDQQCLHLFSEQIDTEQGVCINAYLRIIPAGVHYPQVAFGRVLTTSQARGCGAGKQLIATALEIISQRFPKQPIKISAQLYLQKFYQSFGFEKISEIYDEDGIDHIDMLHP